VNWEGMGHAFDEIYRVLKPGGYAVDIRPFRPAGTGSCRSGRPQITCIGNQCNTSVGALQQKADDFRYADRLLASRLRPKDQLQLLVHQTFYVAWYCRSFEVFDHFVSTEWQSLTLGQVDRHRIQAMTRQDSSIQIRIDMPVQMNVMQRIS
jgi:hypothetical protein